MKKVLSYLILNPEERTKPLIFSFFVTTVIFIFQYFEYSECLIKGTISLVSGDSMEYITSSFNIINNGCFYPDGKMPGYALFLAPLFLIFGFKMGLTVVVIIQYILHAISILYLAKLSYFLKNSTFLFNIVFYFYLFSTYVITYSIYVLSDSLTVSFLIITIYLIYSSLNKINLKKISLAGFLFCILIFLRPICLALGVAFILYLCYFFKLKKQIKIKLIFCFFISFIISDTIWVIYKYKNDKGLHPFMSFNYYFEIGKKNYYIEEASFVASWGGDVCFWDPTSEMNFFGLNNLKSNQATKLPNYIYTYCYNLDSLRLLQKDIGNYEENKTTMKLNAIKQKFNQYTLCYIKEKPFMHYLTTFGIFKRFIVNGYGTTILFSKSFSQLTVFKKIVKIIYIVYYFTFGFFGFFAMIYFTIKNFRNKDHIILISLYLLISTFVLCFVYRFSEYRYFVTFYPFTLIYSCLFFDKFVKLKNIKSLIN